MNDAVTFQVIASCLHNHSQTTITGAKRSKVEKIRKESRGLRIGGTGIVVLRKVEVED